MAGKHPSCGCSVYVCVLSVLVELGECVLAPGSPQSQMALSRQERSVDTLCADAALTFNPS